MPTNLPGALDDTTSLPTINAGDTLAAANHDDKHNDVRDAVLALEELVGVPGSADTASLEYRLTNIAVIAGGVPSVVFYGADPTGVADSTAAIDAAGATGFVYFPPGTYIYNGTGIDNPLCHIIGSGSEVTHIELGATSYLYDISATIQQLTVARIHTVGGKGAIRQSDTGPDSYRHRLVFGCFFEGYTEAAIVDLGDDTPFWLIRDCFFEGANYTTTMGVALAGQPDNVGIVGCAFVKNRVGVKLTYGWSFVIRDCAFFRLGASAGSPRVDAWIVPRPSTGGNGGSVIKDCKFGGENLETTDWRIVIANEGAGTDFASKWPAFATQSTNAVATLTIRDCQLSGIVGSTDAPPLLYTTTPALRGLQVGPITIAAAPPRMIAQSLTPIPLPDYSASGNVLGPVILPTAADLPPIPLTNNRALWNIAEDPTQFVECLGESPFLKCGGGSGTGYKNLTPFLTEWEDAATTMSSAGGATKVDLAGGDSRGGDDAIEVTVAPGGVVYTSVAAATAVDGRPCWIEFEIKAGATSTINRVEVCFGQNNNFLLRRTVVVTSAWTRHRFFVTAEELAANQVFTTFGYPALTTGVTGTKFQLGRIRVYQAREPVIGFLEVWKSGDDVPPAAGTQSALPATPQGYLTVYINGARRQIAYY